MHICAQSKLRLGKSLLQEKSKWGSAVDPFCARFPYIVRFSGVGSIFADFTFTRSPISPMLLHFDLKLFTNFKKLEIAWLEEQYAGKLPALVLLQVPTFNKVIDGRLRVHRL